MSGTSRKRYKPSDPKLEEQVKALKQTVSTQKSLLAFATEWGTILGAAALSWIAFWRFGVTPFTVTLYVVAILLIGVCQRALECLIHEATHMNLSHSKQVNDRLAWALAVLPLAHNLATERASHLGGHHRYFWVAERDPDYQRYQKMGLDRLPAGSYHELVQILVCGFIPYLRGALPAFFVPAGESSRQRAARMGFWAGVIAICWVSNLLPLLTLYWVVPFFTALTLVRYLGEIGEHSALGCSDEFGTTRNNLGWFNEHVIHPRGDAYHLVHHLYPKVPFHQMARAHRLLLQDPTYAAAGHHCTGLVVRRSAGRTTLGEMAGVAAPPLELPAAD